MGRYIGPKNKLARRFGINLGLKSNATKVARRLTQPPGVHGLTKRKGTESGFGKQLLEKQKAKIMFGIRERQFRRYVTEATREKGDSGKHLQYMLEMRFDNVVYRAGFAATRAQARQMVTHGMFTVNGKRLNIPSHLVKAGDIVCVAPNKTKKKLFEGMAETLAKKEAPSWCAVAPKDLSVKVVGKPADADLDRSYDVQMIIEYYSTR